MVVIYSCTSNVHVPASDLPRRTREWGFAHVFLSFMIKYLSGQQWIPRLSEDDAAHASGLGLRFTVSLWSQTSCPRFMFSCLLLAGDFGSQERRRHVSTCHLDPVSQMMNCSRTFPRKLGAGGVRRPLVWQLSWNLPSQENFPDNSSNRFFAKLEPKHLLDGEI